jgi:hypothetical protein
LFSQHWLFGGRIGGNGLGEQGVSDVVSVETDYSLRDGETGETSCVPFFPSELRPLFPFDVVLSKNNKGIWAMILVKCDHFDSVVENGKPCGLLCAKAVMQVSANPGKPEFQVVTWTNAKNDVFTNISGYTKMVCLDPYPSTSAPSLIADECKVYKVWGGPVLFLFCIYDDRFDASAYLGNIYSVNDI